MASQAYRRYFTLVGKVTSTLVVSTSLACGAVGVYGAAKINQPRQRWFTDNFTLTPETLRLPFKRVKLVSKDKNGADIRLDGWFVEQTIKGKPSKQVVMCCAPFNHDKSTLLGVCRSLWDHGSSVFLFDFRSFAKEETSQSIGHFEYEDAQVALQWVLDNKPKDSKVGLVGCSMGGAIALMLASEGHEEIVGCATDCAFSSLKDVIGVRLDKMLPTSKLFGLDSIVPLHALFLESICLWNRLYYGYDPAMVGPRFRLEDITIPLLVVHSELDSVVPLNQGYEIFAKSGTPIDEKAFYVVKGAEHIESYFLDEKEYSKRIVGFFDQCFHHSQKRPGSLLFVPGHEMLGEDKSADKVHIIDVEHPVEQKVSVTNQ